jgi:hypothetical protein
MVPPEAEPVSPEFIPLALDESVADLEFSSICWWGDELLLLPQYPESQHNSVFALHRDSIARAIREIEAGTTGTPLQPRRIPTDVAGVPESIPAYDGLEALSIQGDRCFAIAEFGEGTDEWGAVLVSGSLERDHGGIRFEKMGDAPLGGEQMRVNFTHEALVLSGEEVWVICELNGRGIVERPVLARFSRELESLGEFPMPALEYRVTDATDVDSDGRFWVLNIFWPPDAPTVKPEDDTVPVERLIPLRRQGDAIVRDEDRPVLDLRGGNDHPMHNWEGVARWGERGFLLVTDSYPADLLAYVALPD